MVLHVDLAGDGERHFTQSSFAGGDRVKHDEVHQRRREETVGSHFEVVLVHCAHARSEFHADRNHFRRCAQGAGNPCRTILLERTNDVQWHRQLERILDVRKQRDNISRRHRNIRRTCGQIRMTECIYSVAIHVRDRTVGAPTEVASNHFDVDRRSGLQLARGRSLQVRSTGTAASLHRRETERVEERRELLQSSLRRAGNEKRRLDMHQRWRAARLKWACAQQRLGQKQLMQGYTVGEFLKLA